MLLRCAACEDAARAGHRAASAARLPCAELLEPAAGAAKAKELAAHRILVTARSLRSVDSSATRTTDTEGGAAGVQLHSARAVADVEAVKCLLLRALMAALPLLEPAGAAGRGNLQEHRMPPVGWVPT